MSAASQLPAPLQALRRFRLEAPESVADARFQIDLTFRVEVPPLLQEAWRTTQLAADVLIERTLGWCAIHNFSQLAQVRGRSSFGYVNCRERFATGSAERGRAHIQSSPCRRTS